MPPRLDGLGVLVTRPELQAANMCRLIEQSGGEAILLPVLEIQPLPLSESLARRLKAVSDYQLSIFISANAVTFGLQLLQATGLQQNALPPIACVGASTAKTLKQFGITPDLQPKQEYNSEGLLALPELKDLTGKKILIFRGEGGRELLAQTLCQRGASVDYAEVYRRVKPDVSVQPILERWRNGEIQAVTVTSNEGLSNLYDMVGEPGRQLLLDTPMIVISERGREFARRLGVKQVIVAHQAKDEAIVDALERIASE